MILNTTDIYELDIAYIAAKLDLCYLCEIYCFLLYQNMLYRYDLQKYAAILVTDLIAYSLL